MKTLKFKTDKEVVLNHPAINDVLIYDIETNSLDKDTAAAVFVGFYSYRYGKYFAFNRDEHEEIQALIDEHRVLVGFNSKGFDRPILENITNQFSLTYKVEFDCLAVLYDYKRRRPNREVVIKLPDGRNLAPSLPNRKLKTVAEVMGFPVAKGDIDYNVFKQPSWTEVELKDIYTYLVKDIDITRRLFEFYIEYFEPFREYVNDQNIMKFDYIRSSLGSYAYSAICNLTGMETIFEDDYFKLQKRPWNAGGFVLEPQVPYAENVMYLDFSSLYPNIFIQCNLFSHSCSCCSEDEKWNGGEFFDLRGKYCSKRRGKIETAVADIYKRRKRYKETGNSKELALKIMINTLYGLTGSPIFKNIYHEFTSGDCTSIGRKCIQYTREVFEKNGCSVVYGDTDSVFVQVPKDKTKEEIMKIAEKIVEDLQSYMPFAW